MGRLGPEELSPQTIQFRAPLAGVWQRLAGKLPLPKPEVRAEGEGASVQCSHTRSKGETEAQRGAGPCPGSHSGFLFCLHSQHCKIRASPTPRELGWVGGRKVAQRRHRPPPSGQCRSPGAFRTAPESRRPPTLKVTSILWTLQVASCKRKDEGTEGRAHARRLWDREVALSPFPTHSSPWGSWRSLPALRALGDFHSLVLPSTRGGCQSGQPAQQDKVKPGMGTTHRKRRQQSSCNRLGIPRKGTSSSKKRGEKCMPRGVTLGAHCHCRRSDRKRERPGARAPQEGRRERGAHSTIAGRWCAAAAAAASAGACAWGAGSAGECACSAALGGRWRALFWWARRPASCE